MTVISGGCRGAGTDGNLLAFFPSWGYPFFRAAASRADGGQRVNIERCLPFSCCIRPVLVAHSMIVYSRPRPGILAVLRASPALLVKMCMTCRPHDSQLSYHDLEDTYLWDVQLA